MLLYFKRGLFHSIPPFTRKGMMIQSSLQRTSSVETSNFFRYLSKSKSNCTQNDLSKSKSSLLKQLLE